MKSYFGFRLSKGHWPICVSKGFPNGHFFGEAMKLL